MLLSDVCLSHTSGITREQRGLGSPKLAQGVAHVTRDSDTTFKVKVTRPVYSPRRLRTGSGQRGNVLSVGNCCYVAVCRRGGARRYGAHTGRRGAGAYRVATRTACLSCGSPRSSIMDCCTPAIEPTATFT